VTAFAALASGMRIAYADDGPRASEALPLVLVHGFTGHRDDFAEVRPALAHDRRVVAPDLRGHGDSGRTGRADDYTFERAVDDLLGMVDALGIARCHWLGHSMGGMVALRLALARPERVASLIALSTAPAAPEGLDPAGLERAAAIARGEGMEALQRRVEARGRRHPDPTLAGWAERYWLHHRTRYAAMDPAAYAGFARAMLEQTPIDERLGEIRVPCLIAVGEHDRAFLPGADRLEAGLRDATRVTLAGAGHHPHQEARARFLGALRAHLDGR
jgi:pimeloyl-ACP methyl ester carboxylesterase